MAKKRAGAISRKLSGKLTSAYRAVVAAKSEARGAAWSVLHRVESELARAQRKRPKISHAKTAKKR